jgi:hypothetical protein
VESFKVHLQSIDHVTRFDFFGVPLYGFVEFSHIFYWFYAEGFHPLGTGKE